MNTKLISDRALDMINQYKNFQIGNAVVSIPYFNNKVTARRGGIKVLVGKGSPKDIFDEVEERLILNKIEISGLNSDNLKKFLVDNNIGIDCSGFAYYVLNEDGISKGKGTLDRSIHFVNASNILFRLAAKFKPEKNIDVLTFASDKNSRKINISEIEPGDMITMVGGVEGGERNHILIINQVEYQNSIPVIVHYVHSVAWPTDGEYGHGIHEGIIEIVDTTKNITEQRWVENEKTGGENYTYTRAEKSTTEIRRLNR